MRDDTIDTDVGAIRVAFSQDFEPGKLSERERECLRAFLPGLIMELIQTVSEDENEE